MAKNYTSKPTYFHIPSRFLLGCFGKIPISKNFPRTILEQNWEKTPLKMPRSDKSGQMVTNQDKSGQMRTNGDNRAQPVLDHILWLSSK